MNVAQEFLVRAARHGAGSVTVTVLVW